MSRVRAFGALGAIGGMLALLTVVSFTSAAWAESMGLSAQTRVPAGQTPPPVDPPPVDPPPVDPPPVEPPPVTPPPSSAVGPLVPGAATTLSNIAWTFPATNNQGNTCVAVDVASTSAEPWTVGFLRDVAPLFGSTNIWVTGGTVTTSQQTDRIVYTGTSSQRFSLCMNSTSNPPPAPDRFAVDVTAPVWDAAGRRACWDATVRGTEDVAEHPFFFGWNAVIDLTAARAMLQANGISQGSNFTVTPPTGGSFTMTAWNAGSTSVTVTSTTPGAIRGEQERSIHFCLVG